MNLALFELNTFMVCLRDALDHQERMPVQSVALRGAATVDCSIKAAEVVMAIHALVAAGYINEKQMLARMEAIKSQTTNQEQS